MDDFRNGNAVVVHGQEPSIMSIVASAMDNPNFDTGKLDALLKMQREVMKDRAVMAFNGAFSAMQAELPVIEHDKVIDHSGRKIATYAKFETINEIVRPILQKHGFAISFHTSNPGGKLAVTVILTHKDGHSQETTLEVPLDTSGAKNATQAVGSTVSYGKRYALCCILNITTKGEDDDAAYADKRISPAQAHTLEKLLYQIPEERQLAFMTKYGEEKNVKKSEFQRVLATMQKEAQL